MDESLLPPFSQGALPPSELVDIGVAVLPTSVRSVPERICRSYEFIWMVEGRATARIDGTEFDLPRRSAFLVRPGDRVAYEYHHASTASPIRHGFVHFRLPDTRIRDDWPRLGRLDDDDVLLGLLEHIVWLDAERPDADWEEAAHEAMRYAIRAFTSGYAGRMVADRRPVTDVVRRAVDLLTPAWNDGSILPTPTLDNLAAAAGVGREYLCRVFAQEIGLPPLATLRLLRLSRAASLLRVTSMPVADVGRATGFNNEFHFSRTFRSHFGTSPNRYRRSRSQEHLSLPSAIHRLSAMLSSA